MKRNSFLNRLNPFSRRAAHSADRRRRPFSSRRRLSVEALEQRNLLTVFTVTSTADDVDLDKDDLTLREAILLANADPDTDTIAFNINGGGAQTITLGDTYLGITQTVIIDGSTQPADINGTSLITIDASAVDYWTVMDVRHGGAGSTLRNFQISNVPQTAISLVGFGGGVDDGGGNRVENLEISGYNSVHWMSRGLWIMSDGNTIQGTTVSVSGAAISIIGANENMVDSCDLNNSNEGVHLGGDSNDNQIVHNNASNNSSGVNLYLVTGTGNRIIGNDFSNTGTGIRADYEELEADHIEEMLVVRNNVFTNTTTAVWLVGLYDIDVVASSDFDIDVREARYGLYLWNASSVTIDGFDLSGDGTRTAESDQGLLLGGTNTDIKIRNIVSQNRYRGINAQGLINSEISNADLSWTTSASGLSTIGLSISGENGDDEYNLVHDVAVENHNTGMYFSNTNNITVHCNRIVNNVTGVKAQPNTADLILYGNQIEGNTDYGIHNISTNQVNAENNYWGSDDGPAPTGSGDRISANVDADPFLTSLPGCMVVDIDVKPGNAQNRVNAKSQGVIPVAILTTDDFDAATVDTSTIRLSGVEANHFALEDVDGDGDLDLILHFAVQDLVTALALDFDPQDEVTAEVELTFETLDEVRFLSGFDTLNFFLPGKGKGKK